MLQLKPYLWKSDETSLAGNCQRVVATKHPSFRKNKTYAITSETHFNGKLLFAPCGFVVAGSHDCVR